MTPCHPVAAAHPWAQNMGAHWRTLVFQDPAPNAPNDMVHSLAPMLWMTSRAPTYQKCPMPREQPPPIPMGTLQFPPLTFQVSFGAKPPVVMHTCLGRIGGTAPEDGSAFVTSPFLLPDFHFQVQQMPLQISMSPYELRCCVGLVCCCWMLLL